MVRQNKPVSRQTSKAKSLPIPNIVPGACLRVIDDNDPLSPPRWRTLESSIIYSPRAINDALRQHALTCGWVFWTCGKELWFAGEQLAHQ